MKNFAILAALVALTAWCVLYSPLGVWLGLF